MIVMIDPNLYIHIYVYSDLDSLFSLWNSLNNLIILYYVTLYFEQSFLHYYYTPIQ